ncbi:MAG: HD-GYP domain-containing protein [Burkholderiaceae bacterium]
MELELLFLQSSDQIAATIDKMGSAAAIPLAEGLADRVMKLMEHLEPRNESAIMRLATAFMRMRHEAGLEKRLAVLARACFYFERIGKSYQGIRFGEFARETAQKNGLKNLERRACNTLAGAYMGTLDLEQACRCLERTLVLAQEMGDRFLQLVAMTMIASLFKEMGLYHDALFVAQKVLEVDASELAAPEASDEEKRAKREQSDHLRFTTAANGLFCATRLGDEAASFQLLSVGSGLLNNPLIDDVARATFESYRATYLVGRDDRETADELIAAALKREAANKNPRVGLQLRIAAALCDWASHDEARIAKCHTDLRKLHRETKASGMYHDDVLRALMQVYGQSHEKQEFDLGIGYAKELVEFTTRVKHAKFYHQLSDRGQEVDIASGRQDARDLFDNARRWLDLGQERAGEVRPPVSAPKPQLAKHDELTVIHDELAKMRTETAKRMIRTVAYEMAENWALAAEFFDDETGQHCFRVGRLAGLLAREIGMDETFCVRIEHAARLHDIGKIGVNELIILKPGPLNPNELAAMRAHALIGAQLLEGSTDPTLQMAASIAKYHHEWVNGQGYPMGLTGANIPLAARICAYADVYDALTHSRPYKSAWSHRSSVEQMLGESGTHFDPELFSPFLRALERYVQAAGEASPEKNPLADMDANPLLSSRRSLMDAIKST